MSGFDVTSQGPAGDPLRGLLLEPAYREGLRSDRASPVAHLCAAAAAQLMIDPLAAQARAATHLSPERRRALVELQAANRGYAALLCGAFVPAPKLAEVLQRAASGLAALAQHLDALPRAELTPELHEASELSRLAVRELLERAVD